MLSVEIGMIIHQIGAYLSYFVIFLIIWFAAIIYNNIRWKKTIIDYAEADVQIILARQENELKACYQKIDDQIREIEDLTVIRKRQEVTLLKLAALLNTEIMVSK